MGGRVGRVDKWNGEWVSDLDGWVGGCVGG